MTDPDHDPLGLQEFVEQEKAIITRRIFKWGFPPFVVALILGAVWFLKWFWGGWVMK